MSGFSLNLKVKTKKSSKTKRKGHSKKINVFGVQDTGKTSDIIKITHVEKHEEHKLHNARQLVIKPANNLRSSLVNSPSTEINEKKLKFGLIRSTTSSDDVEKSANIKSTKTREELEALTDLPEITHGDEYEEVPIEEFGDALLRGMGWEGEDNDNQSTENHSKTDRPPSDPPRVPFAGIGSKVGAFSADMIKNKRFADESYLPIIKVSKTTKKPT